MTTERDSRDNLQSNILYDILDALSELVRTLGGPKVVGPRLRPELPMEQATQWVRDCLNVNRREKFDPAQVCLLLRWGREKNWHGAMNFIARDAGYGEPPPLNPADEQARLVRTIQDASQVLKEATQRLDEMSRSPLALVPAKAAQA